MELRHLRYFVAVAEERHVTRAAQRLGIQQPPLSQQIRSLEREIGVPLFRRLPRGVELTAAGEAFLTEARAVLDRSAQGVARARLAAKGQHGRLVVGTTTSACLHPLVPRVLGEYSRSHPGVALDVREANASDLTEAVARGEVDAGFLRAAVSNPLGLAFTELLREPLVIALPERHGLPHAVPHGPVTLDALRGERFILVRRPAAPGIYAQVLDACRTAGFEPDVVAEVGRMLTAISLVAAGVGITTVPASMAALRPPGVRYASLDGQGRLEAPLTLIHRIGEARPVVVDLLSLAVAASPPKPGITPPAPRSRRRG